MKKLASFILVGLTSFLLLSCSGSDEFKDSYSLQEATDSVLKIQAPAAKWFYDAGKYSELFDYREGLTSSGNFTISGEIDSAFAGKGSGNFSMNGIDFSMKGTDFQLDVDQVKANGDVSAGGINEKFNLTLNDFSTIFKENFFVKSGNIEFADVRDYLPQEATLILEALNNSNGKSIVFEDDFSEVKNAINAIMEYSLAQKEIIESLQNNALLEAYKQDGLKYHLQPTKFACDLGKTFVENTEKLDSNDFSELQSSCSDAEYAELLANFQEGLTEMNGEFYAEIASKNAKVVFHTSNEDVNTHFEIVSDGKKVESYKLSALPTNTKDGKGIELVVNNSEVSGFLDFADKYSDFYADVKISGKKGDIIISGNVSNYEKTETLANISGKIGKTSYSLDVDVLNSQAGKGKISANGSFGKTKLDGKIVATIGDENVGNVTTVEFNSNWSAKNIEFGGSFKSENIMEGAEPVSAGNGTFSLKSNRNGNVSNFSFDLAMNLGIIGSGKISIVGDSDYKKDSSVNISAPTDTISAEEFMSSFSGNENFDYTLDEDFWTDEEALRNIEENLTEEQIRALQEAMQNAR